MMESDPLGKNPHEPGAKLDAGKLRAGLVLTDFSLALTEVCKVGTYGANKYTDHGWLSVPNGVQRYMDALYRHLLLAESQPVDKDTGLSHLSHAAWNILAVVELIKRNERKELQDEMNVYEKLDKLTIRKP